MKKKGEDNSKYANVYKGEDERCTVDYLIPGTAYVFRVRGGQEENVGSKQWSGEVRAKTQHASDFSECVWKECPASVVPNRKYAIDNENKRIVTRINSDGNEYCTAIGTVPLPLNKVTSWSVKILRSMNNDCFGNIIGVAPSDIDLNEDRNYKKCGWYFNCYDSALWSGPPHNYESKEYGPKKGTGKYVRTGDTVGFVMDTAKGELSFVVNNVNLGVAYKGIPLDKPLVPCVTIKRKDDSIEFIV